MAVVAISLPLLLAGCSGEAVEVKTATATVEDLAVTVRFKGELEAADSQNIVAPDFQNRPEIAFIIDDGERVAPGDRVVEFDMEDTQKEIKELTDKLALEHTRLEQVQKKAQLDIRTAEAMVETAELDLGLAELAQTDSETVPRVEREAARVDLEKAKMATDRARDGVKRAQLDTAGQVRLIELAIRNLEIELSHYEEDLANAVLTAERGGLALVQDKWDGKWQVGDDPWPNATLVKLPSLDEMKVVGWVPEVDAPQLAKGQVAEIEMDAHPDAPTAAEVTDIALLAEARGDDRVKHFRVELALDVTSEGMKPGMTVQVEVVTARHSDAIVIPEDALVMRDGVDTVWTRGTFGWTPVAVSVEAESEGRVAVSGIEPGTVVAIDPPDTLGS
jgi:HlyD family secretion protein